MKTILALLLTLVAASAQAEMTPAQRATFAAAVARSESAAGPLGA